MQKKVICLHARVDNIGPHLKVIGAGQFMVEGMVVEEYFGYEILEKIDNQFVCVFMSADFGPAVMDIWHEIEAFPKKLLLIEYRPVHYGVPLSSTKVLQFQGGLMRQEYVVWHTVVYQALVELIQ